MNVLFPSIGLAGIAQGKAAATARLAYFEGGQYTPALSQEGLRGNAVMEVSLERATIDEHGIVHIPIHNTTPNDMVVNEVGFFFEDGNLLAIGSTMKLTLPAGSTDTLLVRADHGISVPKRRLTDAELAEYISYQPATLEDANQKIDALLHHIAAISKPECKVAYEVYVPSRKTVGELAGAFWSKEEAENLVKSSKEGRRLRYQDRLTCARINVVKINGKWHKLNVIPFDSISGDESSAIISKAYTRTIKITPPEVVDEADHNL